MKYIFRSLLILIILFGFEYNAYSMSNHKIKEICKRKRRVNTCIKDLTTKRDLLFSGKQIDVKVIPYKR